MSMKLNVIKSIIDEGDLILDVERIRKETEKEESSDKLGFKNFSVFKGKWLKGKEDFNHYIKNVSCYR